MLAIIIVESLIILILGYNFFDKNYSSLKYLSRKIMRLSKEREVIHDILSEDSPDKIKLSALTAYLKSDRREQSWNKTFTKSNM